MSNLPENMNSQTARQLLKVGEAFRIPGPFFSNEEIKMGNVNHTYKVNYIRDDGSGMAKIKSYLVQRVNTYAFQRPLELMSNIVRELHEIGRSDAWISKHLGMDRDELLRLKQITGLTALFKEKEFGRAWIPEEKEHSAGRRKKAEEKEEEPARELEEVPAE